VSAQARLATRVLLLTNPFHQALPQPSFAGAGTTLSGRGARGPTAASGQIPATPKVKEEDTKPDPWANLQGGSSLNRPSGGTAIQPIEIDDDDDEDEGNYVGVDSGSEFNGFDEDDDAIMIDSD
jgi:hypothetical protein